jgi:hypothetical protein
MKEYENKTYEYWRDQSFPIAFERAFEHRNVQVEMNILESTPRYYQIGISVDAGWRSLFYPFGKSFIVEKPKETGN